MALERFPVDGKLALDKQTETLNFMMQVGLSKVITYSKRAGGEDLKVNEVVLDERPPDQPNKNLELVAISPADNPGTVVAERLAQGQVLVFQETAFVEGQETTVIGFRVP